MIEDEPELRNAEQPEGTINWKRVLFWPHDTRLQLTIGYTGTTVKVSFLSVAYVLESVILCASRLLTSVNWALKFNFSAG